MTTDPAPLFRHDAALSTSIANAVLKQKWAVGDIVDLIDRLEILNDERPGLTVYQLIGGVVLAAAQLTDKTEGRG